MSIALIEAAGHGDLETLQRLIAAGDDIHTKGDWALRIAARNGHTEIVEVLLAAGADVHAMESTEFSCQKGYTS